MVAVGIAARMLGMRLRLHDFEDIFIAGLLHDIGLILEDQHVHAGFCKVIDSMAEGQSLCALETQHVGFDHCRLGESLAKAWKLPGGVAETIRYHHDAARYTGPHISTVRCVETANFICSLKGITSVGMQLVAFPKETFQQIGMSRDDLVVLATDLDREMSINENMFQI